MSARRPIVPPSRGELLDAAWQVAQIYRDYGGYGGSEAEASRALARRCRGCSLRRCRNAFRKAVDLYNAAYEVVDRHAPELWRQRGVASGKEWGDLRACEAEIAERFRAFRASTRRGAVAWVWFWHHLK